MLQDQLCENVACDNIAGGSSVHVWFLWILSSGVVRVSVDVCAVGGCKGSVGCKGGCKGGSLVLAGANFEGLTAAWPRVLLKELSEHFNVSRKVLVEGMAMLCNAYGKG